MERIEILSPSFLKITRTRPLRTRNLFSPPLSFLTSSPEKSCAKTLEIIFLSASLSFGRSLFKDLAMRSIIFLESSQHIPRRGSFFVKFTKVCYDFPYSIVSPHIYRRYFENRLRFADNGKLPAPLDLVYVFFHVFP